MKYNKQPKDTLEEVFDDVREKFKDGKNIIKFDFIVKMELDARPMIGYEIIKYLNKDSKDKKASK